MPIEKLAQEKGGSKAYDAFGPAIKEVTAMLKENPEGPYFLGNTVSYADFVWAALLVFFKRIGQASFNQLLERSGDAETHLKLLEACAPWIKRSDY